MGSLATAIAQNATRKGPVCSVKTLLDQLGKGDRADLLAAFDNPLITAAAIRRGLLTVGHTLGSDALRRHRKAECGCAR